MMMISLCHWDNFYRAPLCRMRY